MYNAVLRHWPEDIYGPLKNGGNLFATTIFVLVNAISASPPDPSLKLCCLLLCSHCSMRAMRPGDSMRCMLRLGLLFSSAVLGRPPAY